MVQLNKIIEQQILDVPKLMLRRMLANKLKEQGLDNNDLVDKLTAHVLSKNDTAFEWDDGNSSSLNQVNIEITKTESEKLVTDVQTFLDVGLPRVIKRTIAQSAKYLVKRMEVQWPEQSVHDKNEQNNFCSRLNLRWSAGLIPLRMMLIASREIGQNYGNSLLKSRAKSGQYKRQTIALLHMRACQTTLEILVLLENGLPDGAFARWRTLYELSVVALLIDRFGDKIAQRYLAHDVVSMREAVINELNHQTEKKDRQKLKADLKDIDEIYEVSILEFGKPFATPYGWAAESLNKKSPRFQDLETAIDWKALPPNYKWSSYKIHAGAAGTLRTIGSVGQQQIIHAGATNAGLSIPIINTAYSLLQITSLIFGKRNSLETQIQMCSLDMLRDKAKRECRKITLKLEEEELEFHGV